jgi:hypothetical protein
MKSIVARIERIRSGHSERALIHAVDKKGHDYKIEVPIDEVSELPPGDGHLLVMSWSIHASPVQPTMATPMPPATSSPTPTAQAPPAPSSVDAQFMALMSRGGRPNAELSKPSGNPPESLVNVRADAAQAPAGTTPDEQLANMLGMPRDSKPTT